MDSFIGEPLVVSALMLCPQMGKVMVIRSRLGDTLLLMGRGRVSEIRCYLWGGRVSEIRCYLWGGRVSEIRCYLLVDRVIARL